MILDSNINTSMTRINYYKEERINFSKYEHMLDSLERYSKSLDKLLDPELNSNKRNKDDRTTT